MTSVDEIRYLGFAFGIIIIVAGTIGNFLAILAYFSHSRMKTTFNKLVVNLAVADLIISTTILPMIAYGYYNMVWPFPPVSCSIFAYFYYASRYTSSGFLVVISFNRFMHVTQPFSSYRVVFSMNGQHIIILLTWTFSILCLLPLVFTDGLGWWEEGLLCTFTRRNPFSDVYSIIMRILFQLFPLLCMIVMYGMIFYKVKKSHASVDNPKVIVSNGGSVTASTGTRSLTGTPIGTPTPQSYKRPRYKHQLSYDLTSLSTRSTALNSPDLDFKSSWKPSFQVLNELDSQKKSETSVSVIPNMNNKKSIDENTPSPQRHFNNAEQKETKRNELTEDVLNLPHVPQPLYSNLAKKSVNPLQSRSVTFSTFNDILNQPPSNNQTKGSNDNMQEGSTSRRNSQSQELPRLKLFIPQRPRFLSVSPEPHNSPSTCPRNGIRRRSNTTSLPTLDRSRGLSASFSNMMDFVRQQKERRKMYKSAQHAKDQRKLLYMCTVICSAFAFCSLPSLFINLIEDYETYSLELYMITTITSWFPSMINPIVYAAMNVQFRREYSRLFHKMLDICDCRKKKNVRRACSQRKTNLRVRNGVSSMTKATMKNSDSSSKG